MWLYTGEGMNGRYKCTVTTHLLTRHIGISCYDRWKVSKDSIVFLSSQITHYIDRIYYHLKQHSERLESLDIMEAIIEVFPEVMFLHQKTVWKNITEWNNKFKMWWMEQIGLKEYYEIVDEARPLSGFVSPHMLIFLQKCISNHETNKQASKFQNDPSSNCFTIDVWNINCWLSTVSSLLFLTFLLVFFFVSHFTRVL